MESNLKDNILNELNVRFACKKCGNCCKGDVALNDDDLDALARCFEMSRPDTQTKYTRIEAGKMYLKLKPTGCIFLKDNECQIYEHRPHICRLFPFLSQRIQKDNQIHFFDECAGSMELHVMI